MWTTKLLPGMAVNVFGSETLSAVYCECIHVCMFPTQWITFWSVDYCVSVCCYVDVSCSLPEHPYSFDDRENGNWPCKLWTRLSQTCPELNTGCKCSSLSAVCLSVSVSVTSLSLSVCVCVSLFHTHTHTHTLFCSVFLSFDTSVFKCICMYIFMCACRSVCVCVEVETEDHF